MKKIDPKVLLLVVLVAAAGAGWLVWNSTKTAVTPETPPNPASQAANQQPAGPQTPPPVESYLQIPEWGIKFKLSTAIAGAYYDTTTSSPLDSLSLRDHSLDSEPDCTTKAQSVAAIFRVAPDLPDDRQVGKTYSQTYANQGTTIGDYFYFIEGAQYGCAEDPANLAKLPDIRAALLAAGKTIEKL